MAKSAKGKQGTRKLAKKETPKKGAKKKDYVRQLSRIDTPDEGQTVSILGVPGANGVLCQLSFTFTPTAGVRFIALHFKTVLSSTSIDATTVANTADFTRTAADLYGSSSPTTTVSETHLAKVNIKSPATCGKPTPTDLKIYMVERFQDGMLPLQFNLVHATKFKGLCVTNCLGIKKGRK